MASLLECVKLCKFQIWWSTINGVYITFNYKYDIKEIYKIYIQKTKKKPRIRWNKGEYKFKQKKTENENLTLFLIKINENSSKSN